MTKSTPTNQCNAEFSFTSTSATIAISISHDEYFDLGPDDALHCDDANTTNDADSISPTYDASNQYVRTGGLIEVY